MGSGPWALGLRLRALELGGPLGNGLDQPVKQAA
jgi:hypothetical protein